MQESLTYLLRPQYSRIMCILTLFHFFFCNQTSSICSFGVSKLWLVSFKCGWHNSSAHTAVKKGLKSDSFGGVGRPEWRASRYWNLQPQHQNIIFGFLFLNSRCPRLIFQLPLHKVLDSASECFRPPRLFWCNSARSPMLLLLLFHARGSVQLHFKEKRKQPKNSDLRLK